METIDDDLKAILSKWNPMEEAYHNEKFNAYKDGPGANLDPLMQIGKIQTKKQPPYLVFTKMPAKMNINILKTMCQNHGKILDVRVNRKTMTYFVNCASVADTEAIERGLSNNEFGFKVFIGKQKIQEEEDTNILLDNALLPSSEQTQGPQKENRTCFVSERKVEHRNLEFELYPKNEDYEQKESLLLKNDPERQFLNLRDERNELERLDLYKPTLWTDKSSHKLFKNGMCYKKLPENVEKIFKDFCKKNEELFEKSQFEFLGTCSQCGAQCFLHCPCCKTFYCGTICEALNLKQHRLVCEIFQRNERNGKENPEVFHPRKSSAESNESKGYPLSGAMVVLTAILKTNLVYIRTMTIEENLKYLNVLTKVERLAKSLKPFDSNEPKIGEMVLALFEGSPRRAIILGKMKDDLFRLTYIDYGGVDEKTKNEIYQVTEELKRLSILVKPVILANVPDYFLTNEIRSYMYTYLEGVPLKILYSNSDYLEETASLKVILYEGSSGKSFNESLLKLCKAVEPIDEDIIYDKDLEKVNLPLGENIKLVVMDNSMLNIGTISCTTEPCVKEIQKFQQQIEDYVATLNPNYSYAPRVGELCLVQYEVDQRWYRGACCELVGDGFPTILFIDYGHLTMVNVKFIRKYPRHLYMPIFTMACEIKGLPEVCDDILVNRAEELIPNGFYLICDKIEFDSCHIITIEKITNTLKAEVLLSDP